MKRPFWLAWSADTTIRVRLAAVLAVALLPVLAIGAAQSVWAFRNDANARRETLRQAALSAATTTHARVEAAGVLLQTLGPRATGLECASRLAEIARRLPGYENLIRFDRNGRMVCASATVPPDAVRATRPWFSALAAGDHLTASGSPGVVYASEPSLIAAVRAEDAEGRFDGAFAAVMSLASLKPDTSYPGLPDGAEAGLADQAGRYVALTDAAMFPPAPTDLAAQALKPGGAVWTERDGQGRLRTVSAVPLVGDDLFVVLSTPAQGLFSWARLNPISRLLPPLLAFVLALGAVIYAADRTVVRWIAYLQRVASIYARGRFTVRPLQAEHAPPEIRDLAGTLDEMAAAIVAKDSSLHESLEQKDGLMREIHHRVKNNLQVISSLLSMQQRALEDPAARLAISDTRQRITALALIYRALYQGVDLKRVDLRPFLEELVAQVMAGDSSHTLRTEVHADPLVIDPDRLAPLALFAVEAINNAQKHAFTDRGGTLRVDFHVRGDQAELS
ncbi:MAG: sensor histidine kinase, partial [Caulobacterales bacterium]|nr:sensor histidine kinase [Caulobacterales bacterium]